MQVISKKANKANYGGIRDLATVKYGVIHFTGNKGDTAQNNLDYFAREVVKASAHYFVDDNGMIGKSVPLKNIAWAVGANKYYNDVRNANSVSIEICNFNKLSDLSYLKLLALKDAIRRSEKHCYNIVGWCRHYDVTHKQCPMPLLNNTDWERFCILLGIKML